MNLLILEYSKRLPTIYYYWRMMLNRCDTQVCLRTGPGETMKTRRSNQTTCDGAPRSQGLPSWGVSLVLKALSLSKSLWSFSLLILFLSTFAWSIEKPLPSLAVLPLQNQGSADYDWLSSGFAHTLVAKISGTGVIEVLEREHIHEILDAGEGLWSKPPEEQRKLLGADYLLIGSYVVHEKRIRTSVRIVKSDEGTMYGDSVVSETGDLENIFDLENRLAKALVKKAGWDIGLFKLEERLGNNVDSHLLYLRARTAYENGTLREALDLVKAAQAQNQNLFFAEAHHLEGMVRMAMASLAEKEEEKRVIQEDHVQTFRSHAAEASHAFFDLGLAQYSLKQYEEAISSYQHFLQWCSENSKLYLWNVPTRFERVNTPSAPGYYEHGKRMYGQNDCWCCRQYAYRGWTMEETSTILFQKDDKNVISLVCLDNLSGECLWNTKPPGLLNPMKLALLSQNDKVFLVSDSIAYIFDRKSGELKKTFPLEDANLNRPFGMLPQVLYDPNKDVLFVYHQLLNERHGEYAFHLRAYSASDGSLLWKKFLDHLKYRQGTMGLWNGNLVLLQNGKLELLDPTTGDLKNELGPRDDQPVVAYWPGPDHILVRYSDLHRISEHDSFWAWTPQGKENGYQPKENIFFTYLYNKVVNGAEEMVIPIVDRTTGLYRLIPAMWLLPRTVARGMDSADTDIGNPDISDTIHHPWVRLEGDRLWVWNRNRMLHLLDAKTGELLWRHYLPRSGGGIDTHGSLVTARLDRTVVCLNAKGDPLSRRSIEAQIQMAKSQGALGRFEEMVKTYEEVIVKDSQNDEVHQSLALYYESVGELAKAAFHHDHVIRFANHTSSRYRSSMEWMRTRLGLKMKLEVETFRGIDLFGEGLLLHDQKGLRHLELKSLQFQDVGGEEVSFWSVGDKSLVISESSSGRFRFIDQDLKVVHNRPLGGAGKAIFNKIRTGFSGASWGMPYLLEDHVFFHSYDNESIIRATPSFSETPLFERSYSRGSRFDSNGKILLSGEPVAENEKGEVSHFLIRALGMEESDGPVGHLVWEQRVDAQGRQSLASCVVVGEEAVIILDSYEGRDQQSVKTSSLCRLDLKSGKLLSRSSVPNVSIESIKEREHGLVTMTVFKRTVFRVTVFYEEGMDMEDILSRKGWVSNGDPFRVHESNNVWLIGGDNRSGVDHDANINLTDGKTGEVIWNQQAFAIGKPSAFVANSNHFAFYGDGTVYVIDMNRFLKFVQEDLKAK